jgi:hypothetical protein
VSSFNFMAPYPDSVYAWYGFIEDETSGMRIAAANVANSTDGEIEYELLDGVAFGDFDTFVLFDMTYFIPVAEAMMSSPTSTMSSEQTTTMSQMTESPPTATYVNGGNGRYAKPDCTTPPDSGTNGGNEGGDYEVTEDTAGWDGEGDGYEGTEGNHNGDGEGNGDDYFDEDKTDYGSQLMTSAGFSLLAFSTLGLASMLLCIFF